MKESYGARIVAVEALECPTMLYSGFGAHNIQGIGDKHIPLIHNVYNTDIVTAVTDRATDHLSVLFSSPVGLAYLAERRNVPRDTLDSLSSFGLSSICNILAAVKTAKYLDLGPDDVLMTVATDGAEMYESERLRITEPATSLVASTTWQLRRPSVIGCSAPRPIISWRRPTKSGVEYSISATSRGSSSRAYPSKISRRAGHRASGRHFAPSCPNGTS